MVGIQLTVQLNGFHSRQSIMCKAQRVFCSAAGAWSRLEALDDAVHLDTNLSLTPARRLAAAHGRPPRGYRPPCSSAWPSGGSPWAPKPSAPAKQETTHMSYHQSIPRRQRPPPPQRRQQKTYDRAWITIYITSWPVSVTRTSSSMRMPTPRYLSGALSFSIGAGGI
jgi:hypothetical protein